MMNRSVSKKWIARNGTGMLFVVLVGLIVTSRARAGDVFQLEDIARESSDEEVDILGRRTLQKELVELLVQRYPNVKKVYVEGAFLGPSALGPLRKLTQLEDVQLFYTNVADHDLQPLMENGSIKTLTVRRGFLTDRSIRRMLASKSLVGAALHDLPLFPANAEAYFKSQGRVSARISFSLPDGEAKEESAVPAINYGTIQYRVDSEIVTLRPSSTLTTARLDAAGWSLITAMKDITELRLQNIYLCEQNLAPLSRLPNLRRLFFKNVNVQDEAFATLGDCAELEELCVVRAPVSDAMVLMAAHIPKLQHVNVVKCRYFMTVDRKTMEAFLHAAGASFEISVEGGAGYD